VLAAGQAVVRFEDRWRFTDIANHGISELDGVHCGSLLGGCLFGRFRTTDVGDIVIN
jgi:hypothetical protein